jgi:hypothetical protein
LILVNDPDNELTVFCKFETNNNKSVSTNDNVTLGYTGFSAITSGDGTLKIKITYKINEI